MKFLLTSSGVANPSIHDALVDLLGKPISESSALFIPTAIYPFPGGSFRAREAICGTAKSPLCELGWNSLGVLELTALASIPRESWAPSLEETDALLVWGGNVLYLNYWMQHSGLAELLPSYDHLVYVGVSAGSIVTTPYNCDAEWNLEFVPEGSDMDSEPQRAMGLVDFTSTILIRCLKTIQWRTSNDGRRAFRGPRTQLMTRPHSKWSTERSKSSPKGTGRNSALPQRIESASTFPQRAIRRREFVSQHTCERSSGLRRSSLNVNKYLSGRAGEI